ncbi:MAG TPA: hypothetical protein VJR48_16110, partial [Ktedonobacterales bacterium]|nr:hypothetical protein [Ktedonobacterales bacterium]
MAVSPDGRAVLWTALLGLSSPCIYPGLSRPGAPNTLGKVFEAAVHRQGERIADEQARGGESVGDANSPFTADGVPRALWWDEQARALRLLDQRLLPGECVALTCSTAVQVGEAIRTLQVRGAPAIGGAAAYGLALGAREALPPDEIIPPETALVQLNAIAAELRATRPTAVNLAWALERLLGVAERHCLADEAVA